jgi:hypothetical protein
VVFASSSKGAFWAETTLWGEYPIVKRNWDYLSSGTGIISASTPTLKKNSRSSLFETEFVTGAKQFHEIEWLGGFDVS